MNVDSHPISSLPPRFVSAALASLALGAVVAVLLAGCANPQPPGGGPRDETPPRVLRSSPEKDAVNVDARSIRIEFSEYVDRTSLARALSVTPAFDETVEIDWSGRAVELTFPEALRERTTYIVTLDTELEDTRGVSLDEPIQIAFATGPRINQGRIAGTVVDPEEGKPQPKVDVYAYPAPDGTPPDSLPERPAYRTQTSEEGTFSLEYLREQPYYVIALSDGNRNRRPDVLEPFATPPRPVLPGEANSNPVVIPWVLARLDTIPPLVQRVQTRSSRRLTIRFSEPVYPSFEPSDYALRDSTQDVPRPIERVYANEIPSTEVTVRTRDALSETRHRLRISGGTVVDSLGTPLADTTLGFDATARPDTSTTRFTGFLPADAEVDSTGAVPLLPGTAPGVAFSQPVEASAFGSAIVARDTVGDARVLYATTSNGTSYRFLFDPPFRPGDFVELSVDDAAFGGPDSLRTRTFRVVTERALGELEGRAVAIDTTNTGTARADSASLDAARTDATSPDSTSPDSTSPASLVSDSVRTDSLVEDSLQADSLQVDSTGTRSLASDSVSLQQRDETSTLRVTFGPVDSTRLDGRVIVEMIPVSSTISIEPKARAVGPDTTFLFREVPEGSYRFRAFVDRNENERWDPGEVHPYRPAEPLTWTDTPTDSRPRWTTVLPAALRIPVFARPIRITVLEDTTRGSGASRRDE